MCQILYLFYQCGHKRAVIYPHTPCQHYLANAPLSGLDARFKQNVRLCRAARLRQVKTLKDEFCRACNARICQFSPGTGARLAQELRQLGEEKERKERVWLKENVVWAQYMEDGVLEENVVDSERSETADSVDEK